MPAEGVVAVNINVTAKRWAKGWELHIEGHGVTQSKTLTDARRQVVDYLESLHDMHVDVNDITVSPALPGELLDEIRKARSDIRAAERDLARAAARQRRVALTLRREEHLSVTDTAALMEVSRGRVSQLTAERPA